VIDYVSSALVDRVQLGVELGRRSECVSQVTGHSLSEGRIARMSGL
jgi:hypothetical protein